MTVWLMLSRLSVIANASEACFTTITVMRRELHLNI